jgi:hypothetical protein
MQTQAHTANRAQRRAKPAKQGGRTPYSDPVAGLRTLHNCAPYRENELVHEHVLTRCAFDRLRNGQGVSEDFDRISMMLNIGLVRSEGIDDLLVQTMVRGQDAMCRMKDRVLRGLPFGFDASGLMDVPVALDAFEAILDASSPQQMVFAMREVYGRIGKKYHFTHAHL